MDSSDVVKALSPQADSPSAAALGGSAFVEREVTSPPGKCKAEYVGMLQSLLQAHDESRTRLKETKHKLIIKQIYSLMQGYDAISAPCYCGCDKLMHVDDMEVHHINGNPSDNRIVNTAAVTPRCNKRLNGKKGGEINKQRAAAHASIFSDVGLVHVRENAAPTLANTSTDDYAGTQWTSKEGKKHDKMRFKWDRLLWTLFNPEDDSLNWVTRKHLANFARSPNFVGEGTSTTFYKMIAEDVACGILREDYDKDGNEAILFNWPSEPYRAKLRELALAYSQGRLTDAELSDGIRVMTPSAETRPYWAYVWYVQKKIGRGSK